MWGLILLRKGRLHRQAPRDHLLQKHLEGGPQRALGCHGV